MFFSSILSIFCVFLCAINSIDISYFLLFNLLCVFVVNYLNFWLFVFFFKFSDFCFSKCVPLVACLYFSTSFCLPLGLLCLIVCVCRIVFGGIKEVFYLVGHVMIWSCLHKKWSCEIPKFAHHHRHHEWVWWAVVLRMHKPFVHHPMWKAFFGVIHERHTTISLCLAIHCKCLVGWRNFVLF